MRISAKVDYAVRALCELAARDAGHPTPTDELASAQQIPVNFLKNILGELRAAGIVSTQRGRVGGSTLARPADAISVADVIRALEGPLAAVHGQRPGQLEYPGSAAAVADLWVAVRAAARSVLEHVTLADLVAGQLDPSVRALLADPEAWRPH